MAFSPVAFIAPNYRDYKNYWLKFYEPSTTTPKAISLDGEGLTQVAKLQLNIDGFIVSAGDAIVMPYVDSSYDGYLFPTEAEADNNDTINAIRVADDLAGVNGAILANSVVTKFDTLQDVIDEESTLLIYEGAALNLAGRNSKGDGGGAMWDVVLVSSVTTNIYDTIQLLGVSGLAAVLRYENSTDLRQLGFLDQAGFDATSMAQHFADKKGKLPLHKTVNPIEIDAIITTRKTSIYPSEGEAVILGRTPTTLNTPVFKLVNEGDHIATGIIIDVNNTSRSAVRTEANNQFAYVHARNISADADSSVTTSALDLAVGDNFNGSVLVEDVYNTGNSNESVPRAVSVGAYYGEYKLEFVNIKNKIQSGQGGGIVFGGGDGTIVSINSDGSGDNVLYGVGVDCSLNVLNLYTREIEEGVVGSGSSEISVGTWHHYGEASWLIGIDDCKSLSIDELVILPDPRGDLGNVAGIIRTRSGNGVAGPVSIGKIRGSGCHRQFADLSVGDVEYLTIGEIDYTYEYDLAITGAVSQWFNLTACAGYNISDFNIRIKDINDQMSGEVFQMQLPYASGKLSRQSYANSIDVTITDSSESAVQPSASLRITSADEALVQSYGYRYQVNIGPYARETGYSKGAAQAIDAAPTIGNWKRNEDFLIKNATSSPFRARCTVSGSPGTWVTY